MMSFLYVHDYECASAQLLYFCIRYYFVFKICKSSYVVLFLRNRTLYTKLSNDTNLGRDLHTSETNSILR